MRGKANPIARTKFVKAPSDALTEGGLGFARGREGMIGRDNYGHEVGLNDGNNRG